MVIGSEEMQKTFQRILEGKGYSEQDAAECAEIFVRNSLDGIYSHGVNRFARIITHIDKGYIKVHAQPEVVAENGVFERWDGRLAMGNLNAKHAMARAIALARRNGVGLVALGNTNHWLRGGYYGWQAADAGCVGLCWTNTCPNMPVWGGKDERIGNNPLVMAVPKADGRHVVADSSVAQFSYGKLEEARLRGEQLPFVGGYDSDGVLTRDPGEIEKTRRVLPIGYWKGSGISLLLDLMAAILSGANSVTAIGRNCSDEYGLSQVFLAMDPSMLNMGQPNPAERIVAEVIADIKASAPVRQDVRIRYPGEREYALRKENLQNGIPVFDEIWQNICRLQQKPENA